MKNKILKTITAIAGIGWAVSVCMLDSESYIPYYVLAGCTAWLGLFALANID